MTKGEKMSDKVSSDAKKVIKKTFKMFVNLLKEFPISASEDFVYDDSTLKKIGNAGQALNELAAFVKVHKSAFPAEERQTVKDCQTVLSGLMEEMPLSSEDEFLYDPLIHQKVEDARETIVKLGSMFS